MVANPEDVIYDTKTALGRKDFIFDFIKNTLVQLSKLKIRADNKFTEEKNKMFFLKFSVCLFQKYKEFRD